MILKLFGAPRGSWIKHQAIRVKTKYLSFDNILLPIASLHLSALVYIVVLVHDSWRLTYSFLEL